MARCCLAMTQSGMMFGLTRPSPTPLPAAEQLEPIFERSNWDHDGKTIL